MEVDTIFEGRALQVDLNVTSWGSETTYSPLWGADGGDPVEFEITAVWDAEGEEVRLSDDEMARLDVHLAKTVEFEPPTYDDDWWI